MADGNKRYLGDVFINRENAERQRQFFRDVIDSYQYKYGGFFDAATLQGLSADDFATKEQGDKADNSLIAPLLLGRQSIINKNNEPQYIYSDAVKLEPDTCLSAIEWYQNLPNNDITEALCSVYNEVTEIKQEFDENGITIDYLQDNNYEKTKNIMLNAIEEFEENGQSVAKINADLVNGFRFIPITQDAYDLLPTEDKQYWRNIYIIKDASEIANIDNQGNNWRIIENWQFQVVDGNLCFNNGISSNWNVICPLEDLLTDENIGGYIEGYMREGDNFKNILKNISNTTIDSNWDQYPFLSSSLHNTYVDDITVNQDSSFVESYIDMETNLKNVNINLDSILQNDSYISGITNDIQTNQNDISTLNGQVSSIGEQINTINSVNSDQQSLLDSIDTKLTNISNQLNSINANITKWSTQKISGMTYTDPSDNTVYRSECSYNKTLGLAYVRLSFTHYHIKGNTNWEYRKSNANTSHQDQVVAKPISTLTIPCISSPETFVCIEGNGAIKIKSTSDKTGRMNIFANALYRVGGYNNIS